MYNKNDLLLLKEIMEAQKQRQGKAQGESFESDLSTWFLLDQYIEYQASKESDYSFSFFPGFDDITKLEDVVIRYEYNALEQIIFVQAKHVLKPNKNIIDQDLFSLDGNFSLLMYCNAYIEAQNNPDFLKNIGSKDSSSNVELNNLVEKCILATCKGIHTDIIDKYLEEEPNNRKWNIGNRKLYKPSSKDENISLLINDLSTAFNVGELKQKSKLTALYHLDNNELKKSIEMFLEKLIFVTNLPRQSTVNNLEHIIKTKQIIKIKINGKLLERTEIDDYFNALEYLILRRKGEHKTLITPKELDKIFSDKKQVLDELLINRERSNKLAALNNVSFTEESIQDLRKNRLKDFLLPEKIVLNITPVEYSTCAENVLRDLQELKMQQLTIPDLAKLPDLKMLAEIIHSEKSKSRIVTLFKQNYLYLAFIQGNANKKLKEALETIMTNTSLKFKVIFISTVNILERAKSEECFKKNPLYNFFEDLNNKSLYEPIALKNDIDKVTRKKTIKKFITEKQQILHLISLDSMELGYVKLNQILCNYSTMNESAVLFIGLDTLLKNHDRFLSILIKYGIVIIECDTSMTNASSILTTLLSSLWQHNVNARIILLTKQGFNLQDILPNQEVESDTIKHNFGDLIQTDQKKLLTRKQLFFLGNEKKISLKDLMGISDLDLDQYLSDVQNQDTINQIIPIETLVQLIKTEDIRIGSDNTVTSYLAGAYSQVSQVHQDVNIERLIYHLKKIKNDNIFVISGINGSEKSKSFIDKLQSFDTGLEVNNIDKNQISDFCPDMKPNSRILLDDDQLQAKHFQQLCRVNADKKIYWIRLKDGSDNKSQFILLQIYNPDLYIDRQFIYLKKVIIKETIQQEFVQASCSTSDIIFLLTGVDNQSDLFKKFPEYGRILLQKNIQGHPGVVIENKNNAQAQAQFDKLVDENKYIFKSNKKEIIHWLDIEQHNGNTRIVWIKSLGTLENLRQHINHTKSSTQTSEKDFINDIKDKSVIIADDPGMGKTTSLIKLCTLNDPKFGIKAMFQSHWVISVNLKDYTATIGSLMLSSYIDDIITLLSKSDSSINTNFTKNILSFAFKNTKFIRPILITFDGFDEVLDQNIRDKIILLMQYLKYDPNVRNVKFWITSRLNYEQTLENALSIFSTKFQPLDDSKKKEFIYKFFKNRLHLTLSKKLFNKTFGINVAKIHEATNQIARYSEAFLIKMKDTFKGDSTKFMCTPLQLYLMLEDSTKSFKEWIENDPNNDTSINFDYLGDNMLSVYEKFIHDKYDIYLEKEEVKPALLQKQLKVILDQHHQNFAKSFILNSARKKSLGEFKDIVLAAGIIKSHGSDIEFIHPTFGEYFAAQVFMHWLEEEPNVLVNSNQQKYLLTEIFMKPDYQLIRTFINLHLEKFMQNKTTLPKETLQQYGQLLDNLWQQRPNPLIINYDQSILYIAVEEGNIQIINFILHSIENFSEKALETLLTKKTFKNVFERNCLYLAAKQVVTEQLKINQGRGCIETQKLYEVIIENFLAITNGKEEMQKKMLFATFFHQEYSIDPVNNYLFEYISEINNDALQSITNVVKTNAYRINELRTIWEKRDAIEISDLEGLFNKVQDQDVISALLNIQFFYPITHAKCSILHRVAQENTDMSDRLEIVQWLITNGANVNSIDTKGWTVLHHITNISDDASPIIRLLVEQGIDINAKNNIGQTALHFNPNFGTKNFNNIKTLVDLGADIDATDNYGRTALHTIAAQGRWDCLKLLIEHNVHARTQRGNSVLRISFPVLDRPEHSTEKEAMLDYFSQFPDFTKIRNEFLSMNNIRLFALMFLGAYRLYQEVFLTQGFPVFQRIRDVRHLHITRNRPRSLLQKCVKSHKSTTNRNLRQP
uniref:Ankyrin repeat protein RF_0381 n=1 Tax=Cacopsylla melanoneura TaxID=428564 RepID=A0A8D8V430_9HEMI